LVTITARLAAGLAERGRMMMLLRRHSKITSGVVGMSKRKSNFYSLFGACLRYHRTSKRTAFKNPPGDWAGPNTFIARSTPGQPNQHA